MTVSFPDCISCLTQNFFHNSQILVWRTE